jgi:hypothetical protein
MRKNIMEPKPLTVVETPECRELQPGDLNLVSGAATGHYQIAGFVFLNINWDQGIADWVIGSGPLQTYP